MKLIKVKHKDKKSADSVIQRKSLCGDNEGKELLSQAEVVWQGFRMFRERRARVVRFVYGDQWGDLINVNGKTMTQREYLTRMGNVALQANLMASKANSIVGSHIKEGAVPSIHSRNREEQALGQILSETLLANWEANDMQDIEISAEQELLYGGLAVVKESFERVNGENDAYSRLVNPNLFAFASTMQDSRFNDIEMTVELHDLTFNEVCAAFVESKEDFNKIDEWFHDASNPMRQNDLVDVNDKNDTDRLFFYSASDHKHCRVIEIWTKERRPRYHVFDQQTAELYDINADDEILIKQIESVNKERKAEAAKLGFAEDEVPVIEMHYFIDEYYFCRFLTPDGAILYEGESQLPNRTLPYTICATPFVNGMICGYIADAVDLQMAFNRELVVYDWMKRLGTKGVTFIPQSIIPDGMNYETFAEQWTSMDGIVFYKPTQNGDKPFVEHSSVGHLNTPEMLKMLSDTMADSVSVSGAIQGKTPYAGTSAQLYAQQKENSTTPIAVIAGKLETFLKHVAIKKTTFIQMFYDVNRYAEIAGGMSGIDWSRVDFSKIGDLKFKFKFILGPDHTSLRQGANDFLVALMQQQQLSAADVLELGEFDNADAIIARLNEKAQAMAAQQQQAIGEDYQQKRNMFRGENTTVQG